MKKIFSILAVFLMSSMILSTTASASALCNNTYTTKYGTVIFGCFKPDFNFECDNNTESEPETNIPDVETDIPTQKPDVDIPTDDNVNIPETDNDSSVDNEALHEYEKEVIRLVNEIRIQNGLNAFETDVNLSRVARIKSQDMKDNNYFSHTSPVYGSPFDMMKKFGISYRTAAENIAKGQRTPQDVVNAWMNSDGHRANILNSSFNKIGVGYVNDGNYWTQMFIGV